MAENGVTREKLLEKVGQALADCLEDGAAVCPFCNGTSRKDRDHSSDCPMREVEEFDIEAARVEPLKYCSAERERGIRGGDGKVENV
jgi:hypothetical protein